MEEERSEIVNRTIIIVNNNDPPLAAREIEN